jgi:hypothetical protein
MSCVRLSGINQILQRKFREAGTALAHFVDTKLFHDFINAKWTCNTTSTMGEIFNCGETDKLALIAEWLNQLFFFPMQNLGS